MSEANSRYLAELIPMLEHRIADLLARPPVGANIEEVSDQLARWTITLASLKEKQEKSKRRRALKNTLNLSVST